MLRKLHNYLQSRDFLATKKTDASVAAASAAVSDFSSDVKLRVDELREALSIEISPESIAKKEKIILPYPLGRFI